MSLSQASRRTLECVDGGFGVESVAATLSESETSSYAYDVVGRMTSRAVDGVTTALGWDPLSNLTSTSSSSTPADARLYAYDASGQRVAQIVVDQVSSSAVASKVTVYVGDLEATDGDGVQNSTALTATRYLTFGGATVATVTSAASGTPSWSLLLGDGQGSAQVAMELVPVASGTGLEDGGSTHAVTRNAYLPFGATRGGDNLATSRGWLGQVADTDTGLIYLNARYYDPVLSRFVSPDPLMNPGDPKTLDPYRYADNNPVMMTDATGLTAACSGLSATNAQACMEKFNAGWKQTKPGRVQRPAPAWPNLAPSTCPARPGPSGSGIGPSAQDPLRELLTPPGSGTAGPLNLSPAGALSNATCVGTPWDAGCSLSATGVAIDGLGVPRDMVSQAGATLSKWRWNPEGTNASAASASGSIMQASQGKSLFAGLNTLGKSGALEAGGLVVGGAGIVYGTYNATQDSLDRGEEPGLAVARGTAEATAGTAGLLGTVLFASAVGGAGGSVVPGVGTVVGVVGGAVVGLAVYAFFSWGLNETIDEIYYG